MTDREHLTERVECLRQLLLLGKAGTPEECPNPRCRAWVDPVQVKHAPMGAGCQYDRPEEWYTSTGERMVRTERRCPYRPIRSAVGS